MRFEEFESRIVFDGSLGNAVEFDIDTTVDVAPTPQTPAVPTNIEFREDDDDFVYSSDDLSPAFVNQLVSTSEGWLSRPETLRDVNLSDTDIWRKMINYYPPQFQSEGYFVAERFESYHNAHTMLYARKRGSDDFALGGSYMKQDHHYKVSFDVRHPTSEMSWLTKPHWGIVSQFWGPRESGETARNPPFSIYTSSTNGVPEWVVSSIGDSRRITQTGDFEDKNIIRVPMTNIGEWNTWDIEYVPNPFGEGMVRTWLNGEVVSEWLDVKTNYFSIINNIPLGPLNPGFGLYSSMPEDGMEAHFDNIVIESNGLYQSSISGRVTGNADLADATVFATNVNTGERFGAKTGNAGVYSLAVPKGQYTLTAVNTLSGHQETVSNINTSQISQRVDVDVTDAAPATPPASLTTVGDLNGDGKSDIVNRLADGSWQITLVGVDDVESRLRTPRDPLQSPSIPGVPDLPQTPQLPSAPEAGQGNVGTTAVWTKWSTDIAWTNVIVADFTGDGMDDIAGRADNGQWWVAESTGSGFKNRYWGKWTPGIDWQDVMVGDFNGDNRADIAGRAATNGSWWVSMSDGSSFANSTWGRWSLGVDWQSVSVGDFNGDGLDDIAGRAGSDGSWWVAQSDGAGFHNRYWGRFSKSVDWSEVKVGDFNGDGRSDIIARASSDGSFWVAQSTGTVFRNTYYGRWSDNISWLDVSVADVDGDGRSDLVGRASSDGSWWAARSTGERFQNYYWGAMWDTEVDWLTSAIADFDGDGTADLLGANASHWWMSR